MLINRVHRVDDVIPSLREMPLPAPIQAALGELVGAVSEGLLALRVGVLGSASCTS